MGAAIPLFIGVGIPLLPMSAMVDAGDPLEDPEDSPQPVVVIDLSHPDHSLLVSEVAPGPALDGVLTRVRSQAGVEHVFLSLTSNTNEQYARLADLGLEPDKMLDEIQRAWESAASSRSRRRGPRPPGSRPGSELLDGSAHG